MSHCAISIIFTAKPYSSFSAFCCSKYICDLAFLHPLLIAEIILDIFVNSICYYNFFRYKRSLILLVTVFNIDEFEHIFPATYV